MESCLYPPAGCAESLIWDATIRDKVSIEKFSTAKLNKLRSELLVPGFDEQLLAKVNSVVPILLVQRPGFGSSNVKFGETMELAFDVYFASQK